MLPSEEIRKSFLDFFKEKGHKIVPSSSIIPADPTSLFTSAGMQQFVLYLNGSRDVLREFATRQLASCQKCVRTVDIEEVGDDTHHTLFEMLGNWSIGQDRNSGYFKEKAIEYALEFFCDRLKFDKNKLWITFFKGEKEIPADKEAVRIWEKNGIPKERIKGFGSSDNFWGPVSETGPCGPCSEIHYDRGEKFGCSKPGCGPNCPDCSRFVELWNLVFMEYNKVHSSASGKFYYEKLPQKSIDTGIGFERIVSIIQEKDSAYETDLFYPLIKIIEKISQKPYEDNKKNFRILADHLRAVSFMIAQGILPNNLGRGYILRRLLRRIYRTANVLSLPSGWERECIDWIVKKYSGVYPELLSETNDIVIVSSKEYEKFGKAIREGMKFFEKLVSDKLKKKLPKVIKGEEAFSLYETYGFPFEFILQLAEEKGFKVDKEGFLKWSGRHREISRKGAKKKFGGLGIEEITKEGDRIKVTRLHTATHLLQAALRKVLGSQVKQMGSDINPKRLRFDFSFSRKMTPEEIKKTEDLVNKKIKQALKVKEEKMPFKEAINQGALAFFKEKYPEVVSVYSIFDQKTGEVFSKEVCAGPHAKSTKELGKFKIIKEESSSRGVRRIRAVLEQ